MSQIDPVRLRMAKKYYDFNYGPLPWDELSTASKRQLINEIDELLEIFLEEKENLYKVCDENCNKYTCYHCL